MSESAFPIVLSGVEKQTYQAGLTKRELFAAIITHALLTNRQYTYTMGYGPNTSLVRDALTQADALLAELEKEKT